MKYALLALSLVAFTPASAQIKAEHPRNCVMSVGPTQMMFSAFQESKSDDIYCRHVADSGQTMIILDARNPELRDLNIEVRVLRDIGQKDWRDDLDTTSILQLPAKKYLFDKGTTSFNVNFDKSGDYITIVRAFSDDGARDYSGEFRFSVGETEAWYYVSGALVVVVGVACFGLFRRASASAPDAKRDATRAAPSGFRQST